MTRNVRGDIGIHGSLTLAQTLLTAHLVDELRLVLAPSLAGHGKRLFDGSSDLQHFQLMTAQRSGGCVLLHYRRHPQNRTDRATAQGS